MAATPENADRPQMHWSETSQNVRIYSAQSFSRTVEIFPSITDSLFEPLSDVNKSIGGLSRVQFLIGMLTGDPSLRGVMKAISFAAGGVQDGEIKLNQLVWRLSLADRTLSDVLAGKLAN